MKKIYVKEEFQRSIDGEKLQTVTVLESKPKKVSYIVFVK